MVALVVVLGDHLPVRRDLVGVPVRDAPATRRRTAPARRRARRGAPRTRGTSGLPSGCSACPKTQPCQTVTGSSTRQCSPVVEALDVAEAGCALERPAEVVGPRVVGAGDGAAARASRRPGAARGPGAGRCWRTSGGRRRLAHHEAADVADPHRALGGALVGEQVVDPSQAGPAAGVEVPSLPGQHVRGGVGLGRQHLHQLLVLAWREVTDVGHRRSSALCSASVTRRARRAVDVRREEILTATVDLVDRLGLAAVRVADVAAELGVSASLVFYHFGTKDDLVAEAFAHAVERDLGRIDKALAPRRPGRAAAAAAAALRPDRPGGGLAGLDRRLGAGPARAAHPQGPAPPRRPLGGRAAAGGRGRRGDGRVHLRGPGRRRCARVSALLDGLSVATLVYRTVTRAQLREWVAGHVAHELALDVDVLR